MPASPASSAQIGQHPTIDPSPAAVARLRRSCHHEFYIGDEEAQAEHEQEMQAGGMTHDEPAGISVPPGETKELTFTFAEPGETLAGCHEPGHYAGGMKATITVGG